MLPLEQGAGAHASPGGGWPGPSAFLRRLRRLPFRPRALWTGLDASGRWELAFYLLLVTAALGMRLWDLGGRTLHYDELLHAWYGWLYAVGNGYHHTPLTHGPFLFHASAASFVLFGASDVTVRLLPALFGTALVGLPYLLRREMGRLGALSAAVLLAVSPSLLYFSRFVRNDIYMAVWVLALVIVMWRFMERPRPWLLFAWVALWALAFSTKETAFMAAAVIGLALLLVALPGIARWVRGCLPSAGLPPASVLLAVLVTVTLPFWAPLLGLFQSTLGVVLINPDPLDPVAGATRADLPTGHPVGAGLYVAVASVLVLAGVSALVGLSWRLRWTRWPRAFPKRQVPALLGLSRCLRPWPLLFLVFTALWLPLFTSLFTNWDGFFTGLWGSLAYWIAQHPVERADQPWYYYFIVLATYEFLAVVPALVALPFVVRRGSPFDRFLAYWAVMSLLLYTVAGEKMPWLVTHIALPFALLSGRAIGVLVARVPWRSFDWRWAAAAVAPSVALVAMLGMTVFVAGRAAYGYAGLQRPNELLVYAQTGHETRWAAQRIERIAEASGKGKQGLRVLVDEFDSMAWQWRWYLRDYSRVTYQPLDSKPLAGPPDADVVLLSTASASRQSAALEGFARADQLRQLWWFPNTVYKGLSPGLLLESSTSAAAWRGMLDYFFLRKLQTPMFGSTGVVYVADAYAGIE